MLKETNKEGKREREREREKKKDKKRKKKKGPDVLRPNCPHVTKMPGWRVLLQCP